MNRIIILFALVLAAGCGNKNEQSQANDTEKEPVAADNTEKNERDTDPAKVTPGDQGENENDLKTTQTVRQAVVADEALSMSAKNAKIITVDGVVTLRGPVASAEEKSKIEALAKSAPGAKCVDNQLEIAAK